MIADCCKIGIQLDVMRDENQNGGLVDLYDVITDEDGQSIDHPHIEPNPERWALVLQHRRFYDSLIQFDDLMRDYDHVTELHVGEESFSDLHNEGKRLPSKLNFYIAENRKNFLGQINHPIFREMESEKFIVPKETNIGLAFGEHTYRHVIDVPENFSYLDVKIPTYFAHGQRYLDKAVNAVLNDL